MELGFNHQGFVQARPDEAPRVAKLDWAGLRARFAAVHALREELGAGLAESHGGSFTAAGSQVLSDGRKVFPAVNPNASGNGKALPGNETEVAVTSGQATED